MREQGGSKVCREENTEIAEKKIFYGTLDDIDMGEDVFNLVKKKRLEI